MQPNHHGAFRVNWRKREKRKRGLNVVVEMLCCTGKKRFALLCVVVVVVVYKESSFHYMLACDIFLCKRLICILYARLSPGGNMKKIKKE